MENDSTQKRDLQKMIEKYMSSTCSREEFEQILDAAKDESNELFEALKFQWDKTNDSRLSNEDHWNTLYGSMMNRAKVMESVIEEEALSEADPKVHKLGGMRRRLFVRMAAAAALIVALSTTIFFLFRKDNEQIAQGTNTTPGVHDIAPGGDKAILTKADGTKIILDTAANGILALQGGIKVIKIGGQLSYQAEGNSNQVLYNTISTPKGGQYQLELADGSKVWLNAASSLRFPTSFIGNERSVELTGEGYFEVAHNANMPFHVKVNPASPAGRDMDVQVLGTHFNINAYGDESNLKTTLIEGSVLVSSKNLNRATVLKPGQQSILDNTELLVNKNVDTEEVIAWKNGQFIFNGTNLDQIMKQVERWYDIEVEFQGQNQKRTFSGIVSRQSNLSEVLKMMNEAGIKFEIEGKKIRVLP